MCYLKSEKNGSAVKAKFWCLCKVAVCTPTPKSVGSDQHTRLELRLVLSAAIKALGARFRNNDAVLVGRRSS